MGWGTGNVPSYVLHAYDSAQREKCRALVRDADVVIWGSCPYGMILPRLLKRKLTFCYSERIFKEGKTGFGYWGRVVKYGLLRRYPQKNHYLLASSAYAAADYALLHEFRGRALRWGYFPQTMHYDLPQLMAGKEPCSILWVARLIPLKHLNMPSRRQSSCGSRAFASPWSWWETEKCSRNWKLWLPRRACSPG